MLTLKRIGFEFYGSILVYVTCDYARTSPLSCVNTSYA